VDDRDELLTEVVELDHRSTGEVDVSLFWNRRTNAVLLQVVDWADDDDFSVPVAPGDAAEAFKHPFAYGFRVLEQIAAAPADVAPVVP
jgi:hypothetical protein